ncbi:hypothetical protein VaNZ11_017011 [Volvox africanus]|uniref:MYND-type domain-containing protein n=1 Tax=Volvox africanus TaxID=51714 RepID=A0ABQ5SQL9_9CHLO|nr:hypothetical protein VaNZ11_017011 [Volvox africanus]
MSEAASDRAESPSTRDSKVDEAVVPGKSSKTCLSCGAIEEAGKKLLRCSGCQSACFCNPACQKAVWKQHKEQCTRCKMVDAYAASPLLAAMAFLPRMLSPVKMLRYEVYKRELRGRELHLYLRNPGPERDAQRFDMSGRIREGPSREQLHNMVQHDGYLEAIVVGTLYGFHYAVQQYNNRLKSEINASKGAQVACQGLLDYVILTNRKTKITEYGIAIGSTCPDYTLVYHIGDKVRQLQDPNNHVWIYFRTERADRLYIDVGSLSYGMGLMLNIIDYLPNGTPESEIRRLTPTLGAPGNVMDRADLATMERLQAGAVTHLRKMYLADRQRVPISSMPADEDPEGAIRGLLRHLRQAVTAGPPGPAAAVDTAAVMGMVAAAAVVTAAAVAVPPEVISAGSSTSGAGAKDSPSRIPGGSSGGAAPSCATGKRGTIAPAAVGGGPASGSGAATSKGRRIPFRDSSLDKHVKRAMVHFQCAFTNTYAVLDQDTYKRYPPSLDGARSFAPWVDVAALRL